MKKLNFIKLILLLFLTSIAGCVNSTQDIVQKLEILTPKNGDSNIGINNVALIWSCSAKEKMLYDVVLTTNGEDKFLAQSQSSTSVMITSLTPSTIYTVKIFAKRSNGEISKSVESSFKTILSGQNGAGKIVSAVIPENGAIAVSAATTLAWETNFLDESLYDVYFGEAESSLLILASNITDKSFALNALKQSTKYYWKVIVKNANGKEVMTSSLFTFTTRSAADSVEVPEITSPFIGDINVDTSPNLTWNYSGNTDGISFEIWMGLSDTTLSLKDTVSNVKTYKPAVALTGNTKYYWKVIAKDSKNNSKSSNIWYFTTKSSGVIVVDKYRVDAELCWSCGKCVPVCPVGAISLTGKNSFGDAVALIDTTKCTGCGKCFNICPVKPVKAISKI